MWLLTIVIKKGLSKYDVLIESNLEKKQIKVF